MSENDEVCKWGGIEPKGYDLRYADGTFDGGLYDSKQLPMLIQGRECTPVPLYPDLATREGFWTLMDALKTNGYRSRVEDCGPHCVAWMAKDGHQAVPAQMAETPWAALFAAAVALMRREQGR